MMKTKTLFAVLACVVALTGCESKPHIRPNKDFDVESILKKSRSDKESNEAASTTNSVGDMNPTLENYYPSAPNVQQGAPEYQEREPLEQYCRACRGTGICHACNGTGQQVSETSITSNETIYRNCRACNGSGYCGACGGDGKITEGIDF